MLTVKNVCGRRRVEPFAISALARLLISGGEQKLPRRRVARCHSPIPRADRTAQRVSVGGRLEWLREASWQGTPHACAANECGEALVDVGGWLGRQRV